jgi:PAS domain S-box-containing protein
LAESEERFRGISASAQDAIIHVDEKGAISFWNPAAERMFGFSASEALGKDVHEIVAPPRDRTAAKDGYARFMRTGIGPHVGKTVELVACRKDGREFPVEISVSGLQLRGGRNAIGIVRDITERKDAERKIHEAREAADAANRAKGEFLANMSHEIRTPMNAIIGMTELALDTKLDSEQQDYIETIRNSADALLGLLNDILDFSKVESGRLEISLEAFDIREAVGDFLKPLAFSAQRKGLEVAYRVSEDVPERVVGDPSRVRQIIFNLVGNAIKFTENGEVVVHIEKESEEDGNVRLHFLVSDTGVGIPPEKQVRIFDPFTQADGSITRQYGGTGLGLAISRGLTQLMGGRMWVRDRPGGGTEFHFTLRFERSAEDPFHSVFPDFHRVKDMPVLIADANDTSRHILERILRERHVQVVGVADSRDAVQKLKEAVEKGMPFQALVLDADLPCTGDGELESWIDPGEADAVPIILLRRTSSERQLPCGEEADGSLLWINKPVKPSELLQALERTLVTTTRDIPPAKDAFKKTASTGSGLRVLLAEDNAVNRKLALTMLEKEGHTVVSVVNGREAVDAVGQQDFDLVLMDVQMPIMDGVEATRRIRELEAEKGGHLPIVALTANAMKGDRERYMDAGMDDYMAKPFKWELFRKVIARNAT